MGSGAAILKQVTAALAARAAKAYWPGAKSGRLSRNQGKFLYLTGQANPIGDYRKP